MWQDRNRYPALFACVARFARPTCQPTLSTLQYATSASSHLSPLFAQAKQFHSACRVLSFPPFQRWLINAITDAPRGPRDRAVHHDAAETGVRTSLDGQTGTSSWEVKPPTGMNACTRQSQDTSRGATEGRIGSVDMGFHNLHPRPCLSISNGQPMTRGGWWLGRPSSDRAVSTHRPANDCDRSCVGLPGVYVERPPHHTTPHQPTIWGKSMRRRHTCTRLQRTTTAWYVCRMV